MLRHPLVYHVPYVPQLADLANEMFLRKSSRIQELSACGEGDRAVTLYERPYRLQALLDLGPLMTDELFWKTAGWVWIDTENADECWEAWKSTMLCGRPNREALMSTEERARLASLPETLTVWRGQSKGEPIRDFSWTLSMETAEWFARRFNNKNGIIKKGRVSKASVIAYLSGRGEEELVIFPEDVELVAERKAR